MRFRHRRRQIDFVKWMKVLRQHRRLHGRLLQSLAAQTAAQHVKLDATDNHGEGIRGTEAFARRRHAAEVE